MSYSSTPWTTRTLLGVMRDTKREFSYWLPMFGAEVRFTTEYIDFEKLPDLRRKIAAFVRPLGQGRPVYKDSARVFRAKPAYIKAKDVIDPLRPLTLIPGLETGIYEQEKLSPAQRLDLLRAAMVAQHVASIERRWEWMACQAIVNASITIGGEEHPPETLDFKRASNQTVVLGAGSRWGDSGISIFDSVQTYVDRMFDAEFGGMCTRITLTPSAWAIWRKDAEIMSHMDTQIRGAAATVERGIIAPERVTKVGELLVGGASGARIEVMLYRDTYIDESDVEQPFLPNGTVVFTAAPSAIQGYRCFGRIVDRTAGYEAIPIYPRNWIDDRADPIVETLLHQSAPLFVPANPNATLSLRPVG